MLAAAGRRLLVCTLLFAAVSKHPMAQGARPGDGRACDAHQRDSEDAVNCSRQRQYQQEQQQQPRSTAGRELTEAEGPAVAPAPGDEGAANWQPAPAYPAQDAASLAQRAAALMQEGAAPAGAQGPEAAIPETDPPRRLGPAAEPRAMPNL